MDALEREERILASRPELPSVSLQISFVEFVGLTAALMALTALSIDIMLPALPQIGAALGVTSENDRQLVVILYMAGIRGRADIRWSPFRSFRPQTRAALRPRDPYRWHAWSASFRLVRDAVICSGGSGSRCSLCPRRRRGRRARSLQRPADGARHVVCDDGLYRHSGAGAVRRTSPHPHRRLAPDVLRVVGDGLCNCCLGWPQAAGNRRHALGIERALGLREAFARAIFEPLTLAYGAPAASCSDVCWPTSRALSRCSSRSSIWARHSRSLSAPSLRQWRSRRSSMRAWWAGSGCARFRTRRLPAIIDGFAHVGDSVGARRRKPSCLCTSRRRGILSVRAHCAELQCDRDGAARPQRRHGLVGDRFAQHRHRGLGRRLVGRSFDGTVLPIAAGFAGCSLITCAIVVMVEGREGLFGRNRVARTATKW